MTSKVIALYDITKNDPVNEKEEYTWKTAQVSVKLKEDGTESTEAGDKYAVVSYKKFNAEAPVEVLTIAECANFEVDGRKVDGEEVHEAVTLGAPTCVKYAKTKCVPVEVEGEVKYNIYAAFRFNF